MKHSRLPHNFVPKYSGGFNDVLIIAMALKDEIGIFKQQH